MNVPVATIRATEHLRGNFDACVNNLRAYILSSGGSEERTISEIKTNKEKEKEKVRKRKLAQQGQQGGNPDAKKRTGLDRWYTKEEWFALSPQTREKILKIRKARQVSAAVSEAADIEVEETKTSQRADGKKVHFTK